MRVSDEHFGCSLVPLHEYENGSWGGSCITASRGRASAKFFLWTDPDTSETCFVKMNIHRDLVVKCEGGAHFGEKASCCKGVLDYWNGLHPNDLAQFVPAPRRPVVVDPQVPDVDIEDNFWPHDDSSDVFIANLCKDWKERDPNSK